MPNWSAQDFPTAQWYHVITTAHLPFHVCGSQQDNSTLCVPSNTNLPGQGSGGNPPVAPYQVGGGERRLQFGERGAAARGDDELALVEVHTLAGRT